VVAEDRIHGGVSGQGGPLRATGAPRRHGRRLLSFASQRVRRAPKWSPLRLLLPIRASMRGEMTKDDVLRVLEVLESAKIKFWLTGGWGVDALLGQQTRRHDDVDIVLEDFDQHIDAACAALEAIGLRLVARARTALMPCICGLEDDTHHRVDLVSLDWTRIRSEVSSLDGVSADSLGSTVSIGTIGGRTVHCVSPAAQVLLRGEPELRRVDQRDIALLESRSAGTANRLGSGTGRRRR